jgi:hypothetical protein
MPVAVVGSLGIALIPALAEASTSSHSATTKLTAKSIKPVSLTAGAAFKKYSSPAGKSRRIDSAPVTAKSNIAARNSVAGATTTTGTTIYAYLDGTCSTDTGTGTKAAPYCNLQDAVNAASPGDTIDVGGAAGEASSASATVKTSNISIVGVGGHAEISTYGDTPSALTLDDVTGVTVSGMMFVSDGDPAVQVIGSSDITFTGDYVAAAVGISPNDAMTIDGASSNVTVTRSVVNNGYGSGGSAVLIDSGASDVTLSADIVMAGGITATGVDGLDVTSNTIQRSCASGIDVEGASSGVFLENNLLEDGNSSTGTSEGGSAADPEYCALEEQPWQPDVTVAAAASAGVTSDYNDFYVGTDGTALYSWAGTTYTTAASFQSGTSQGAHDLVDNLEPQVVDVWPAVNVDANAVPVYNSAAVASANTAAPGEPAADFYGVSPFTTRGAVQFVSPNPNLATALTVTDTTAFGVSATATTTGYSGAADGLQVVINWGDGTSSTEGSTDVTVGHTYAKLGTYNITVTASDGQGDTATNSISGVQTAGSEYTAYGPTRILSTRDGIGAAKAAVAPKSIVKLKVAGAGPSADPIPSGITAVVLNVTVTDPSSIGVLTVYPDQDETGAQEGVAATSNLNFGFNETVPNLVVVPVGPNGVVDFYNDSTGHTQVIADVAGYFTPQAASGYVSITPARLLDTRQTKQTIPANGSLTLTVAGADKGAIPASGVTAVAANLTATNGTSIGFISAYPTGGSVPNVSNVNYAAHQNIPNMAIVPVSSKGQITLHNTSTGSVDVIVDAFGYYTSNGSEGASSAYLPLPTPQRLLDTRDLDGEHVPLPGDYPIGLAFFTTPDVTGAVFNATVVDPSSIGFLSLYPYEPNDPGYVPSTSNVNFGFHETVPNLVISSPGTEYDSSEDGYDTGIYLNTTGQSDLVLDLFGVFLDD